MLFWWEIFAAAFFWVRMLIFVVTDFDLSGSTSALADYVTIVVMDAAAATAVFVLGVRTIVVYPCRLEFRLGGRRSGKIRGRAGTTAGRQMCRRRAANSADEFSSLPSRPAKIHEWPRDSPRHRSIHRSDPRSRQVGL